MYRWTSNAQAVGWMLIMWRIIAMPNYLLRIARCPCMSVCSTSWGWWLLWCANLETLNFIRWVCDWLLVDLCIAYSICNSYIAAYCTGRMCGPRTVDAGCIIASSAGIYIGHMLMQRHTCLCQFYIQSWRDFPSYITSRSVLTAC